MSASILLLGDEYDMVSREHCIDGMEFAGSPNKKGEVLLRGGDMCKMNQRGLWCGGGVSCGVWWVCRHASVVFFGGVDVQ